MTEALNSCAKWKAIQSKNLPKKCPPNCYLPLHGPCPDCKTVDAVNREPSIVKSAFEPDPPVRRLVDTKAFCALCNEKEKSCTLCDAQNATHKNNFCSADCRPLSTSLHLNEWTKRPRPKPTFKHSVLLNNELLVGRVFPMKYCLRRVKKNCHDCGREVYLRDPITDNTNVVLLANCCDVKVYHERVIENWHRVPILSITGDRVMKKKTINETCQLEPKKIPPPPPPEPQLDTSPKRSLTQKKGKGKGKGKKGKK